MGIDRIGKTGPPAPLPEVSGPAAARPSGSAFQVPAAAAPTQAASQQVEPARPAGGALERLRAGEVDLGGYVDLKVHEATAHLSALPPVELERIRSALRDRLAGDPTLADLLHSATGETLPPDDD
jgi:hypothetical protein